MTAAPVAAVDLERRFGGLRRLYGDAGYGRIRAARVAVIGVGGVGSWTVEALARSGVAALVLVDMDHVSESNVNRQVQAIESTLGMAKVDALRQRIGGIHPACAVQAVDAFVEGGAPHDGSGVGNWPALLERPVDAVVDACDDARAKTIVAAWARETKAVLIVVGAAGGKRSPERVETGDLANATHDPLLAALRQRLRKKHLAPRAGPIGIECVFSREPVAAPEPLDADACEVAATDGSLNCHGYGSSVVVTATFGLVAASRALERIARPSILAGSAGC